MILTVQVSVTIVLPGTALVIIWVITELFTKIIAKQIYNYFSKF